MITRRKGSNFLFDEAQTASNSCCHRMEPVKNWTRVEGKAIIRALFTEGSITAEERDKLYSVINHLPPSGEAEPTALQGLARSEVHGAVRNEQQITGGKKASFSFLAIQRALATPDQSVSFTPGLILDH